MTIIRSIRANVYKLILCNEVFLREHNGIPLCFTILSIRIWYPIITEIKYGMKDLKHIKIMF